MKNIHAKTTVVVLGIIAFGYNTHAVFAHGVVVRETKDVENYTLVMEVTSHYPAIYTNDPVTYDFKMYEKGTENEIPYDSSYVYLSKKSGPLIFQTETPAPRGVLPGSQITASVSDVGEYEIEVFFNREEEGEVKTTFNFSSVASTSNNNAEIVAKNSVSSSSDNNSMISANDDGKTSNKIPALNIFGGLALFALGGFLGRVVKKNKMQVNV